MAQSVADAARAHTNPEALKLAIASAENGLRLAGCFLPEGSCLAVIGMSSWGLLRARGNRNWLIGVGFPLAMLVIVPLVFTAIRAGGWPHAFRHYPPDWKMALWAWATGFRIENLPIQ